ncbi:unnamed protein product [Caenorhabditis angaria]|uniref:Uncharacterized protein n=1 Tax=Caenorhabditis angaria TaxID=860376 RepID=A0A9P1N6D7_9PELO|nr:unnamed protein product [Caenorhabditis angaria]
MRPLFKIALTLFIGASIVVCYKIYERKKSRKPSRKIHRTPIKRRISDVKTLDETQREEKVKKSESRMRKKSVRETSSDILHPAPFDNVLGKIPSDKKANKLCGTLSDSEMREIDQKNITFDNCEYIAAASISSSFTGSSGSSRAPESLPTLSSASTESNPSPKIAETFRIVEPDSSDSSEFERSSGSTTKSIEKSKENDPPKSEEPGKENAPPQLEQIKSEAPSSDPLVTPTQPEAAAQPEPSPAPAPAQNEPSPSQHALTEPSSSGSASPNVPREKFEISNDPLASPKKSSQKSSTSRSSQKSKSKFKLCRCRNKNRNEVVEDLKAPKFNENVTPEIAPTTVLPVVFSRYKSENLLEVHGDIVELPDECYKVEPELIDNYLTPLHPTLNAIHAANYHTCLITHLIDNFDFFE